MSGDRREYKYLPARFELDGGFPNGKEITIDGTVRERANNFTVLFLSQDETIPLRMKADFRDPYVTFNAFLDNGWGDEEQIPVSPFKLGENFKLTIVARGSSYDFIVDGESAFTFDYRYKQLSLISSLVVKGDLKNVVIYA